ncbi:polymer-forming cytoskeletal protein [Aeromonas sp. MrichA-1]|uniref:polymer-forming cytoskeletal protein n=1 Tax=Aeromonas sp. MrichA-1 TaxID=2823362 RepID=UPI001B3275FB|nr:polymer-forming cytoskeletal protein [Aeromonas sp. MrichA-1]MBP4081693.1 polymer-forming cytoskeletal protein [Aeromonas sp. MrichA-1]
MKNKGFTLLELLLVIGITTSMAIVSFQDKMLETEQAQASRLGMEIFQYNSAVQNYLAHQSGQQNPASVAGRFKGVNWLKSTSCGGTADKAWLSCSFLSHSGGKTTLGRLGFTTEIKYDPTTGLNGRTVMDKLSLGSGGSRQERADLSGLAALVASGAYAVSEDGKAVRAQDSTVAYCPDTAGTSPINAVCQGDKGSIVMLSRNLSAADRWLRVDHGNAMQNALEFRTGDPTPASQTDIQAIDSVSRQIRNVARIYNLGSGNSNGESDNLYLGKRYGNAAKSMATLPSNAVVIDADQEVLGKLLVAASIDAKGDISTKANFKADGSAVIKKDISAGSDLSVGGKTTLAGDVAAQSNVSIGKSLSVAGEIEGKQNLKIANGGNFGGDVIAKNITAGGKIAGGTLNISGSGYFNGELFAQRLVDSNDPAYLVDPNNESNFNEVRVTTLNARGNINATNVNATNEVRGRTVIANGDTVAGGYAAGQYLLSNGTAWEGGSCHGVAHGAISKDPSGGLLTCKGGVWKSPSQAMQITTAYGPVSACRGTSTATCPAGTKVISGGHHWQGSCGCGEEHRFVLNSAPNGTRAWSAQMECSHVMAVAVCVTE